MYQIDVMSRVPVYEQIVEQTKKFILTGVLDEGDQIPTVRQLSAQLSLNPNTIQKAVKELDHQGLIFSLPGRGCFIAANAKNILLAEKREGIKEFEEQIKEMALSGIERKELHDIIDKVYEMIDDSTYLGGEK